ncbi:MAG: cytochrome c3 family protein [Desulfuromonadaceae bacterium]|nr:cytochrome c3 family protein [Desulfuromonadaceae bacterium]
MKIIFVLIGLLLTTTRFAGASDSCLTCHSDAKRMSSLGAVALTVTGEEVEKQSRMPAGCSDCHLGNPDANEQDKAHAGLARLLVVRKKGLTADNSLRRLPLQFGTNPANRIYVGTDKDGTITRDASVAAVSWHDKRRDTLTQDFDVLKKTCGKCHEREFTEFSKSTMGTNGKQSQYKGFLDPRRGPHNCGPWFEGNFERMQATTSVPMSRESHLINQKVCNTCHVGCLDCHFNPRPKAAGDQTKGAHSFVKTPPSESCYGSGRASICHAGPEDRRRGAGYFGGSFSYPDGNEPDVHLKAGVGCLDCHESTKTNASIGHAMVRRQAGDSCVRCHAVAVKSHAVSLHRNLSCEACHIGQVAGYQGTYWGPGKVAGVATPYFKFKAYYGYMQVPILIKDQKGRWIPVKPFPMAAMNQKESPFKPGLYWRYPSDLPDLQRTDDAWAYVGLCGGLPENNKALLWIQIDKMSHKLGRSRGCDSCHGDPLGAQRRQVTWEYSDPGAAPFTGSHTVLADRNGLFIRDMRSDNIQPETGYALSAFAPWLYLKDKWQVKGDFSLPVICDRKGYDAVRANVLTARKSGILHN